MRGFSDDERDRIREELIETGRELLLTYGPKKTTVADITDPVGIAKPTFYQFFDAKSDLYIVILERELQEYMETARSELEDVTDPQEALKRLFWSYAEFGDGNKFIQQTVIRGNYQDVIGRTSSEQLDDFVRTEMAEFIPLIEDIQSRSDGPLSEMDPLTVLGIMGSSIGLLVLHKDEYEQYEGQFEGIEEGYYHHMQDTLITTLARGLTVER
ncbi:TetR/AcrR family transcriptional regulator [Halococcus thailandensis]|uniref:Transcriptional regulator n=1 Tax=Halococcus thailandensis JCM 13552 TaxID=1227457 RepID=M0NF41_9EURY|nr:helix-turn-helix domain-containing protein [Halococcus thailandensis]EMA56173.1 transcriptional regulator [Halococcus thailandensis JCM 13552]